jgi:isopropylmalate/homocitrate/citramalate synthase
MILREKLKKHPVLQFEKIFDICRIVEKLLNMMLNRNIRYSRIQVQYL